MAYFSMGHIDVFGFPIVLAIVEATYQPSCAWELTTHDRYDSHIGRQRSLLRRRPLKMSRQLPPKKSKKASFGCTEMHGAEGLRPQVVCNFSWPRVFETSLVCQRVFEGVEAEAPAESADVDGDAAEKAEDMAEVPAADAECLCTFCTSFGCSTHVCYV